MKLPKTFIGITNFKWLIIELIKMYSDQPSFFSKKRIHEGIAFCIFESGAIYVLCRYVNNVTDFITWAIPNLLICGYTLNQIQKEKTQTN